jgi:Ricin-type beta-trefoil lectin domain/Putative Ig domain/Subtilase family
MGNSPYRRARRAVIRRFAAVLAAAVAAVAASVAAAGTSAAHVRSQVAFKHACGVPARGQARCGALIRTGPETAGFRAASIGGYRPSDLRAAYGLPSASRGKGQTLAIIDAYDDPTAESDLATYRSTFGLPACTTSNGCFRKVNETGGTTYPHSDSGWSLETSLDLDMVSAVCPNCHIILVEADTAEMLDLAKAADEGIKLGAKFESNSYISTTNGLPAEFAGETGLDQYYNHPGTVITAGAGDNGNTFGYPAASPYVVSVGGTQLAKTSSGWDESLWGDGITDDPGTGAGCSKYEPQPAWQAAYFAVNGNGHACLNRLGNDISAVADPATPVAFYDSQEALPWAQVGGTSAAAPIIAAVSALAGTPAAKKYGAETIWDHRMAWENAYPWRDVHSGNNGGCGYLCRADYDYDPPSGMGTPQGIAGFTANIIEVTSGYGMLGTQGKPITPIQETATDSANQPLTWKATGLPPGLTLNASTGVITGTPSWPEVYLPVITATDPTGASGSIDISAGGPWQVQPVMHYVESRYHTSKCVDDHGGSLTNGNKIDIYSCNNTLSQWWAFYPDGTLRMTQRTSPKAGILLGQYCLTTAGQTGDTAYLKKCSGGYGASTSLTQHWTYKSSTHQLVNATATRCLNIPGGKLTNGTQLNVASCASNPQTRQWTLH